jgi:propanol-preferring alcohol dehydrogenase
MDIQGNRIHQWDGELLWENFTIEEPGPDEVLIQVEACSIGLTVLNCIRGDLANEPDLLPRVPGHEIIGRITKMGSQADSLQVGQRVMAYFYLACGICGSCRSGQNARCTNLAGWIGVHRDGGYASHTILPSLNVIPISETIPATLASAIPDAIATSLHVCKTRAKVTAADRVVVIGAGGGVGAHMIQMASFFGADVVGLENSEEKFEIIEKSGARPLLSGTFDGLDLGAFWNGKRPSVVIDLAGKKESLSWSLDALETGGRMVVLTTFRDVKLPVDPRDLVMREISVLGSKYASRAELEEAARMVEAGLIKPVVSEVVRPEEVESIHEKLRQGTLIGRGALDWTLH